VSAAERLAALLPEAQVSTAHGVVTADVPREQWVQAVTAVRDDPALDGGFFDCLVVVDQEPDGFEVVVRLWSVRGRSGVHLRTRCPREEPSVPSLVGVFAGASWHEREGEEMFGVVFEGAPDRRPLLLPEGGVRHPLRKEHGLAARTAVPWPGAQDPAYSGEGGRPPRRRLLPPGAPSEGGRR
jgi:NADH-quinone oxidoreductase subunit C